MLIITNIPGFSKIISSSVPKDAMEVLQNHRSKIIAGRDNLQPQNKTYPNSNTKLNTNNRKSTNLNYEYDNPAFLNDNE